MSLSLCLYRCQSCNGQLFGQSDRLSVLQKCPNCPEQLDTTAICTLPTPFVSAVDAVDSVLLKPTTGTFLESYQPGDDLHIGISDGTGVVCSYSATGIALESPSEWSECSLVLDRASTRCSTEAWRLCLSELIAGTTDSSAKAYTAAHYSEAECNCFSFVLDFLGRLSFDFGGSKAAFTELYVKGRLESAWKYIRVYRKTLTAKEGLLLC